MSGECCRFSVCSAIQCRVCHTEDIPFERGTYLCRLLRNLSTFVGELVEGASLAKTRNRGPDHPCDLFRKE